MTLSSASRRSGIGSKCDPLFGKYFRLSMSIGSNGMQRPPFVSMNGSAIEMPAGYSPHHRCRSWVPMSEIYGSYVGKCILSGYMERQMGYMRQTYGNGESA